MVSPYIGDIVQTPDSRVGVVIAFDPERELVNVEFEGQTSGWFVADEVAILCASHNVGTFYQQALNLVPQLAIRVNIHLVPAELIRETKQFIEDFGKDK